MVRRALKIGVPAAIALLLLIQAIPYGHDHTNPPITRAARLPAGDGARLMRASCGDCHTNLTKWRWYSNIAPVSWLIASDINGGREHLNFSEWDKPQPALREVLDAVDGGSMPPLKYTLPHPSAKLSDAEKRTLESWLTALYVADPPKIRLDRGR